MMSERETYRAAPPQIAVVTRPAIDWQAVEQYLRDRPGSTGGLTEWAHTTEVPAEAAVEFSARSCYDSFGKKQGRRDSGDYLGNILESHHGSVLEHAVYGFMITGISRSLTHEFVRHRTGWGYCLSGDTLIYSERRAAGKRNGPRKRRLRDLYEMTKTPHGRSRLKLLRLRCYDEERKTFTVGKVKDVMFSGRKPVFRITLDGGKQITCSQEHRFLTPTGWSPLHTIVGGIQVIGSGVVAHGNLSVPIATNGVPAHHDAAWLRMYYIDQGLSQAEIGALAGVSSHTVRTWIRKRGLQKPLGSWSVGKSPWNTGRRYKLGPIHTPEGAAAGAYTDAQRPRLTPVLTARFMVIMKVEYIGEEDTYDIEMEGLHHNFVANGIVTHNSQQSQRFVDESSAQFVLPPLLAAMLQTGDYPSLETVWDDHLAATLRIYERLASEGAAFLARAYPQLDRTMARKRAREMARCVLPNATATTLYASANVRAIRHFIELRGSAHADAEIRRLALALLTIMQREAPLLFADYTVLDVDGPDPHVVTPHAKV